MLVRYLPSFILAPILFLVFTLNVAFWGTIIFVLGLIKLVFPLSILRQVLHLCYRGWCKGNRFGLWLACDDIEISLAEDVNPQAWYLLIANHQSWLDILVLTSIERLPPPKFFLKDELKFVPFVGAGAWALDMPFMKRVSKKKAAKNPKLKGMDVERTKRSCRHFRHNPTTIINFVEGSRFTEQKHAQQQSPFRFLLKPKAGGIAFALEVLGEQMDGLLNTNLVYFGTSEQICRDMLFGKLTKIHVLIETQEIAPELIGNYQLDREFRIKFQHQLNKIWHEKDAKLAQMIEPNQEIEQGILNQLH